MDMKIANSWWMYTLGSVVVIFVLTGSFFFIYKAFKDAKKLNMDKKILKGVIFNSAIFTILPSISILIGVVALSGSLGVPLPWIRLTVIGALHYEGAAAQSVLDAFSKIGINEINTEVFVTIACVMTLGILTGPLFCLFGFKAYDKKVLSKAKIDDEEIKDEEAKPKKNFGGILFNAVFIAMVASFLAVDMVKIFNIGKDIDGHVATPMESFTPTIVILVTFASMFIFDMIEKHLHQKWLSSFSLGLSMLIGMAVAILIG